MVFCGLWSVFWGIIYYEFCIPYALAAVNRWFATFSGESAFMEHSRISNSWAFSRCHLSLLLCSILLNHEGSKWQHKITRYSTIVKNVFRHLNDLIRTNHTRFCNVIINTYWMLQHLSSSNFGMSYNVCTTVHSNGNSLIYSIHIQVTPLIHESGWSSRSWLHLCSIRLILVCQDQERWVSTNRVHWPQIYSREFQKFQPNSNITGIWNSRL